MRGMIRDESCCSLMVVVMVLVCSRDRSFGWRKSFDVGKELDNVDGDDDDDGRYGSSGVDSSKSCGGCVARFVFDMQQATSLCLWRRQRWLV